MVDCKKPKFDGNNANSAMIRNTNPISNERGISHKKSKDGEKSDGKKNLCVTSVTILDTLQGIIEHLRIKMKLIREEMHLYVSYTITLDTHQNIAKGTKENLTRIQIKKETTIEIIEGMIIAMTTIRRK